jgi:8-oxo-dGTP diphosphatase
MKKSAEQQFLESYDPSQFERPSVAVDVVVLTILDSQLHVLLTQRTDYPFKELWALPGGFVRMDESLDEAAARVLKQKGGLEDVYLEQLYTFGSVKRDPRMRILSVAYYALVEFGRIQSLAEQAAWLEVVVDWEGEAGGPAGVTDAVGDERLLAFDHAEILGMAIKRIRGKLEYAPISFELLPEKFTLRQLQEVYETIWGKRVNKDSFRRKVLASGQLEATGELEQGKDFRPAELYKKQRAEGRGQRAEK